MKTFHPRRFVNKAKVRFTKLSYYVIPDSWYLRWKYRRVFGEELSLRNPRKFTEIIQWLKLHDRKELYHHLVDKYEVKPILSKIIGEEYIIPTLGVWDTFSDIDFDQLPNRFVLKCNHDSGSIAICQNKDSFDREKCAWRFDHVLMNRDYYHFENKQWAYKGIRPRIIAEEYLENDSTHDLPDYKFFCFNGEPRIIQVDYDRFESHKRNFYDLDWNVLPFSLGSYPFDSRRMNDKPINLSLMTELAGRIARTVGSPFLRVDFYDVNGRVYFGEVTFYPEGGMYCFEPKEWDLTLGRWINLK